MSVAGLLDPSVRLWTTQLIKCREYHLAVKLSAVKYLLVTPFPPPPIFIVWYAVVVAAGIAFRQ